LVLCHLPFKPGLACYALRQQHRQKAVYISAIAIVYLLAVIDVVADPDAT
jgi:hypothetical protein